MSTTTPRFRLLGIDDEVTACDCCGRSDLKCTMALAELDADGNEVGIVRYGRDCGARALGWKVSATRAEKLARGLPVRFSWDDLYPIAARLAAPGEVGNVGEIDGVAIRAYRTGPASERRRMLADGWNKGPVDLVWRLA